MPTVHRRLRRCAAVRVDHLEHREQSVAETVTPHRYARRRMPAPKGINPKIIGDRTCAMVLARLLLIYETVLLPFGENQRYDLVVDTESEFLRIQCKTGRLRDGTVRFSTCSSTVHHPRPDSRRRLHYRGQADVFGIYCPETDGVYLVPVEDVPERHGSLRVEETRNNQRSKIRWARNYELSLPPEVEPHRPGRVTPGRRYERGPHLF